MTDQISLDQKVKTIETDKYKLVLVETPGCPLGTTGLWLPAGSKYDPPGKEGLAHLFEHLLMIKTKKFPLREDRLGFAESNGLVFRASTWEDEAKYSYENLLDKAPLALELLIDGFESSIMTPEDISSEKKIVLDEAWRYQNDQGYLTRSALYPDTSLGRTSYGDEKSIGSLEKTDFEFFYENHYFGYRPIIVVTGKPKEQEIVHLLNDNLSRKFAPQTKIENQSNFPTPRQVLVKNTNQNKINITIAFKTCPLTSPDWITIRFLRSYLAGSGNSRLNHRLRYGEKYTYWVEAWAENSMDTGSIRFDYTVDPAEMKTTFDIIIDELDRVKNQKISSEELMKHKQSFIFNFFRLNTLDPADIQWWYGWQAFKNTNPTTMPEFMEKIMALTSEELQVVAQKYLVKHNRSIIAVGDVFEEKMQEIIGLN